MNKVSVLIPVYNVQLYLNAAIESILKGSYYNIEIIAIDDCSTDDSSKILREFEKKDQRVKVICNSKNLGISKTLNKGLKYCTGEYILRMDGDDISEKDRIKIKLKFLLDNPEFSMVGCSTISVDSNDNLLSKRIFPESQVSIQKTKYLSSPMSHIWLCKKEVYTKLNGYRELDGVEDFDFILRALQKGYKITNLSQYFGYKVRIGRSGNSTEMYGRYKSDLFEYVIKLDKEYTKNGRDTFPKNKPIKKTDKVFNLGMYHRYNFLRKKGVKRLYNFIIYIILCIVNTVLLKDLYRIIKYRLIFR